MIERVWHGWTTPADADAYERFLADEMAPRLAEDVAGYRGMRVLRREDGGDVEFVTLIRFDSLDAVEEFAGEASDRAHVPPRARELLTRFEERVRHYELRAHFEPEG